MSQKNVIRRPSSHRKTRDGNRSDSGCFDDVDVLQTLHHCLTKTPEHFEEGALQNTHPPKSEDEPISSRMNSEGDPMRSRMNSDSEPTASQVNSDSEPIANRVNSEGKPMANRVVSEGEPSVSRVDSDESAADDTTEFHTILERLAEVTKNPGDMYRLCFSSRLSFAGLSQLSDDTLSCQHEPAMESKEDDVVNAEETTSAVNSGISESARNKEAGHEHCGNREQCVELLSMLSSFVVKANENPAVFNQSGLGKSLLGQLSSLLCTLEGAKNDNTTSNTQHEKAHEDNEDEVLDPNPQTGATKPEETTSLQTAAEPDEEVPTMQVVEPEQPEDMSSLYVPEQGEQESDVDNESDEVTSGDGEPCAEIFPEAEPRLHLTSASAPCLPRIEGHVMGSDLDDDPDNGDVVANGRRTVTPYSWDYGDIWEKELQRAKESGEKLMPTFEDIRDDLFHQAGFIQHSQEPKRRSRSADARSSYQDDNYDWQVSGLPDPTGRHDHVDSPLVRTIHQQHGYPHLSSNSHNSITVNVNDCHGRRVKVFPEEPQLDDSWALVVKDTVVETSTFRGPRPWTTLKRRPSGLRRRSNSAKRSESFSSGRSSGSSEYPRSRLNSRGESESSDSPCCATSSDCLTTDDSSSITSSHYAVQSSPPVSNRNSSCLSESGSFGDLRRVIFQDSSSSGYYSRERFKEKYNSGRSLLYKKTRGSQLNDRSLPLNDRISSLNDRSLPLNDRISSLNDRSLPLANRGSPLNDRNSFNFPLSGRTSPSGRRNTSRIEQWEMTLDERFSCMSRNDDVFNRTEHLSKDSDSFRGSDPNILRTPTTKWSRDQMTGPSLLVRSDSDLNSLTRVQFVGDSYSRSHISKNLRHARRQSSRSPSPGSTQATHTRVVSCEIVKSDDVYTKVSRTACEDGTASDEDGRQLRRVRRSWHWHSPQRGVQRGSARGPTNAAPQRVNSERYQCPSGLVDRRRQVFRREHARHEERPLHAKLVEVRNMYDYNSSRNNTSGKLRSSSDTHCARHVPRMRSGIHGQSPHNHDKENEHHPTTTTARSRNFGRAQAFFEHRPENGGNRRRMPLSQPLMTSPFRSNFGKRKAFPGKQDGAQNTTRAISGKSSHIDSRSPYNATPSKDPVILKETSFVGPATFTKYQSSGRGAQRSRSFNDKDNISRGLNYRSRQANRTLSYRDTHRDTSPSARASLLRYKQYGRRHSEGGGSPRIEYEPREHVVNESYCDHRRDSIQEGTYSLLSAQSARVGAISGKARPDIVSSSEDPDAGYDDVMKDASKVEKESDSRMEVERTEMKQQDTPPRDPSVENIPVQDDVSQSPNGVSICIDYRNKKPISYTGGTESRPEGSPKPPKMSVLKKNKARSLISSAAKSPATTKVTKPMIADDEHREIVENSRKRLSRRERHEQEMVSSKEDGKGLNVAVEVPADSPVPYRRDKSIVYIDARSSVDSDTDSSISHHSSISSSGSDMTVILNDEQNISAGDLRQLAQTSGISPLELGSSDDLLDDDTPAPRVDPVDWSAALQDATQSASDKYSTSGSVVSEWKVTAQEPGDEPATIAPADSPNASSAAQLSKPKYELNNNNNYQNYQNYETSSPCSSNTSSVESGRGIGASSKYFTGKGFLSRLKNFRNSFRGKKSGEKSNKMSRNTTKNAEKEEKAAICEMKTALGSRSMPIIDSNCNEMNTGSAFGERTTSSVDFSIKGTRKDSVTSCDGKPRSSYDGNFRNVVGVKSVSSEHLHSLRLNRRSAKMSAKSLEVLLETCI